MRNLAITKSKAEGASNVHNDSCITSNGGNGTIIRGKNHYERSLNEPKRMGQPAGRNIIVIQPGNQGEARNCKTAIEAWNLLFADSFLKKFCFTQVERLPGEQLHIRGKHIVARQLCII
jgi:hypothetical protein